MLLLVTLALLAGPTCRAQNILGNNVGTYFYVAGEEHGQLRGLRIFLSVIDLIKGIQLRFGGNWSDVYGSRSLKYKEFLLEDGEHVTQVSGTRKLCLTSLSLTTDKGRAVTFGVRRGFSFNESGGSDKYLVTVNGLYAPGLCLNGMGFKWKNIHDDVDNNDDDKEDDDDEHDKDNEEDHGDKDNDKDDDDDKEDDNKEDVDDERDDKDDEEEEDEQKDDDDNDDEDDGKDDDGGGGDDDDGDEEEE
ncbi:prostatic spermine-binding protein [Rattus rattus]|uniref:prostatic spermine-binding protein n=1 Tax=Rattus rattus TaxID=10117 RepID=UPI0013F334B1|nr:prostatic spermine-binding protein [Rattus rattus]